MTSFETSARLAANGIVVNHRYPFECHLNKQLSMAKNHYHWYHWQSSERILRVEDVMLWNQRSHELDDGRPTRDIGNQAATFWNVFRMRPSFSLRMVTIVSNLIKERSKFVLLVQIIKKYNRNWCFSFVFIINEVKDSITDITCASEWFKKHTLSCLLIWYRNNTVNKCHLKYVHVMKKVFHTFNRFHVTIRT